jgi:hypothetical protein
MGRCRELSEGKQALGAAQTRQAPSAWTSIIEAGF